MCKCCGRNLDRGRFTRSLIYPWLCAQCVLGLNDEKIQAFAR